MRYQFFSPENYLNDTTQFREDLKEIYVSLRFRVQNEGQNGISHLISKLLRTLDSSLRDRLFVLQNEVSELSNHAAC